LKTELEGLIKTNTQMR